MSQKRRCWTAAAICAILASGARVPALLGPMSPRSHDPFANGAAIPALHASFSVATEVTAAGDDDGRPAGPDDSGESGDPRPFTADAIYAAISADPLAVRAHVGLLSAAGEPRAIGNPNGHAAGGERGLEGTPHGAPNPEAHAGAHWGSGAVGTLAADTTSGDSLDPRRPAAGGRHPANGGGTGVPFPPDMPPPLVNPSDPDGFPTPIGMPADGAGAPGAISAPPPSAIHAVPLPAPLWLGLAGLALAAGSARKRLGLRK